MTWLLDGNALVALAQRLDDADGTGFPPARE
jgi:hypothetical protein